MRKNQRERIAKKYQSIVQVVKGLNAEPLNTALAEAIEGAGKVSDLCKQIGDEVMLESEATCGPHLHELEQALTVLRERERRLKETYEKVEAAIAQALEANQAPCLSMRIEVETKTGAKKRARSRK